VQQAKGRFGERSGDRMSNLASKPKRDSLWAAGVITFGIGLTAAWIILLGYGLFKLVELVI
jgi:hypothetical protein